MDVVLVALIALGTALATGLGAIPFVFVRDMPTRWIGISGALAAGFMAGASLGLFYEGARLHPVRTIAGAAAGALFIIASRRLLQSDSPDRRIGTLRGANATRALMIVGVMTIHSFTEGVAIGVSFAGGTALGLLIGIALAVHNVPEGLAISLSLVPHGTRPRTAALWSIFSSLPQPLMAVPAFLAVRVFEPLLSFGLGFAGGAMVWMVVKLVPEARASAPAVAVWSALVLSMVGMVALELAVGF